MPKKVRPGSKRLPPWQTPQTQCRGSYSRKMSKKGVFEQAKDTFSLLSSIGISERSQGLFTLARLAAPIYCHWRYCVTCCAWVGVLGGEIKRQGIYVSPLPVFLEPAIARLPKALASLRAPLSLLTRAF